MSYHDSRPMKDLGTPRGGRNNDCSRCHQEEGIAWAVWPVIGKVWLCESCGEVCNKVINDEARKLADKRAASES